MSVNKIITLVDLMHKKVRVKNVRINGDVVIVVLDYKGDKNVYIEAIMKYYVLYEGKWNREIEIIRSESLSLEGMTNWQIREALGNIIDPIMASLI